MSTARPVWNISLPVCYNIIIFSSFYMLKLNLAKLAVTTPPCRSPGRGPITVETVEGGTGISSITFAFVEEKVALPPDVSGVSPREGFIGGGQKVVLRGNNLGECKADVVRVVIGDVDCTETLEYISQCKYWTMIEIDIIFLHKVSD